ncbi:hypothetical protein FQA47_005945 [Oryzias melastigma]|uniref:Uncharacterized protein n=1 Tax=Oryzias melastigma TaxID=30732 RepID=A0A834L288_ORYME|nr:hypothetical protein FQA47_005945 [Oryzias melastigma]
MTAPVNAGKKQPPHLPLNPQNLTNSDYREEERSSQCGSTAAAAAALQWQAVDEASLLPPLRSHFGCLLRGGDSDRLARKKPFLFVRGGESAEMQGGFPQQQQPQHQPSSRTKRNSSTEEENEGEGVEGYSDEA